MQVFFLSFLYFIHKHNFLVHYEIFPNFLKAIEKSIFLPKKWFDKFNENGCQH